MNTQVEPKWHSLGRAYLGGTRAVDIPEPHVRLFPNPVGRKRIVRIHLMRYYGVGKHYYADVVQEHNPIWHEGCWAETPDDVEGAGRHFYSPQYSSVYSAREWVRRTLAQNFPPETHEYRWEDYTCPSKDDPSHPHWFYREGD